MHKIVLSCLTCLILALSAAGQERATYIYAEQLQRDVTLLLLDKNIDDVTKQLETETPSTASLLRRLVIYGRAGQTALVTLLAERNSVAAVGGRRQLGLLGL